MFCFFFPREDKKADKRWCFLLLNVCVMELIDDTALSLNESYDKLYGNIIMKYL